MAALDLSYSSLRKRFAGELRPRKSIYWPDMLASMLIGWSAFALSLRHQSQPIVTVACTVVAVFRGGAGSVVTWWDSAGISESGFNFGGWMGVRTSEVEIAVTKEGTFDRVDRGPGKAVRGEPISRPHTRGY